jgi:hypothetical protein
MGFSIKYPTFEISGKYLTVSSAAEISGYNEQYIQRLLRNGIFKTKKIGQIWLIDYSEFVKYLSEATRTNDKRSGPQTIRD